MTIRIVYLLILIFLVSVLNAQNEPIESITESDLRAHLEFISSDLMQGRDFTTNTPGLEITAQYLKSQCIRLGLSPVNSGEYNQRVELVHLNNDADNTFIQIQNEDKKLIVTGDSIVEYYVSVQDYVSSGGIVYAGYAFIDEQRGYDDLMGFDLKDKYVLIMTRNRELVIDNQPLDRSTELSKHPRIFEKGAKGIIKVIDPQYPQKGMFDRLKNVRSKINVVLRNNPDEEQNKQLIFVTESGANLILHSSGKTIKELQEEVNKTGKSNSFEIKNSNLEIHVANERKHIKTDNIIGIIEGSDPVLMHEYIILSAHYDHLGVNPNGEIYNGADDNGSGTAALLEIAEAFAKMEIKPRRSIIFAWFTAEEKGLLGSKYYTLNPIVPLEKTIAFINLDMVGRTAKKELSKSDKTNKEPAGISEVFVVSGKQSLELIKISNELCEELELIPNYGLSEQKIDKSDYFHFYENGIPIVGLTTGTHEDWHQTSDEISKIDFKKIKRISEYGFLLTNTLANKNERIIVDNPYSH